MNFSTLKLHRLLTANIGKQKFSTLTAVQEMAIPVILERRDCIAIAPTGTGKTEAFAIPIVQLLLEKEIQYNASVLILLPTRELCIQTKQRITNLLIGLDLGIASFYGGETYESQLEMYQHAQIILATPGRLVDFIEQEVINLNNIDTLVIDEFDQLLSLGFATEINKIINILPVKKQCIFISATKTAEIEKIVQKKLINPVEIFIKGQLKEAKIEESVLYVDKTDKKNLLRHLIESKISEQVIVFTRTIHGVERIEADLNRNGISCLALYGDKSQNQREEIIAKFRRKDTRILIVTDLLARGIDFPGLEAVINYEVPDSAESYIHRIGRTGRSEAVGIAITFCDAEDNEKWIKLQLSLKRQIKIDDQHPYLLSWEKMLSSSQKNHRKGTSKSKKRR